MTRIQYYPLRVVEITEETLDSRTIAFEIPADLSQTFAYKPGQFITLRIPFGDKYLLRCYSASSTPQANEPIRVTVKRVVGGRASNWLAGCVRVGDTMEVAPPRWIIHP